MVMLIGIALLKDNVIECKVIYDYNQKFQYEPYLYIDGMAQSYKIAPHTPLNDTYESPWTWFEESYLIPYDAIPMKQFDLELIQNDGETRICSIEFYNHGYQVAKFSPAEINELFLTEHMARNVGSTAISLTGNGEEIILQGNELLCQEIAGYPEQNRPLYCNSAFLGGAAGILLFIVLYRKREYSFANEKIRFSRNDIVLTIGLGLIFLLACMMSILSKHYAHPDESVTRMAIDYYLAGWQRPDMNSSFVSGTISNYGYSRLREDTIYYLAAGKVGWIFREFFNISTYYRMFNLLLLGGMLFFCWKWRKNKRWMMVALCMTPQLWYLYSYATSDAWDWFWGFVMICLLLQKRTFLYKKVQNGKHIGRTVLCSLGYAFVFAMILLGKTNYHVLLGIAFVDFLLGWFQQRKNKLQIVVVYLFILLMSFGIEAGIEKIPGAKPSVSFAVQDDQAQKNMRLEQKEKYGEYLLNGSLKDNGISFWDMLWHYSSWPTLLTIFASATGCYMWLALYSGIEYYILMAIIYFVFLSVILFTAWRNREENVYLNLKVASSVVICCLIVIIVLLYCWMKTYQPQGRYLLTIWMILGYVCAQYNDIFENKVMKYVMVAGCFAGVWSFGYYGLFAMFQQGFLLIS